ncbi:MAG: DUF2892 domain-containing protein [Candidatus Glassbacteria bacterium]
MYVERALRAIAGMFVLLSLALSYYHSKWWLLLTTFVGLNLIQSAFSNWCLMQTILKKIGLKSCEDEYVRIIEEG